MTDPAPLVALTGASGFIGRWIARHLVAAGWRVRVLVRPGSESRLPAGLPLLRHRGTLTAPEGLAAFVAGAQAVVHCAGQVRGITPADFEAVNVAGTRHLAAAAAGAQVRRFVLISSLAAREPHLSPYAASKRAGEEVISAFGQAFSSLALRPPAVYGPGDREMRPLLEAMARGWIPVLSGLSARFSLLYVEDLARAVAAAVRSDAEGVFELDDGRPGGYGWHEVQAIAAAYRHGKARLLPVPEVWLRTVARISLGLARLSGRPPMLTPAKVNELRHPDWVCDNTRICQVLDWRPQVDFATGLARTLASPA